jgi:sugar phosphate isomerase/epimerase
VNKETGEWGPIKREVVASPIPFYQRDEFGKLKYDKEGHPIPDKRAVPQYEKDMNGNLKYGKDGKPILKGYEVDPRLRLDEYNQRQATAPLSSIEYNKSIIEKNVEAFSRQAVALHRQQQLGEELSPEEHEVLTEAKLELNTVKNLLEDYDLDLRQQFHKAYTFSNDKSKEILRKEMINYEKTLRDIDELRKVNGKVVNEETLIDKAPDQFARLVKKRSDAERVLIEGMRKVKPDVFVPTEEFALEKSRETIGNVAFQAFRQFGEKAPVLCIENFFPNTVFSRGDSLKKLITESRKVFVDRAKKEGMNEETAKSMANKLIGATWDLGHINLIRKHGFGIEEGKFKPEKFAKAMATEAKAIAPFVKHVHLTDNFGYNDTHLPPGMGEVPFKEVLRELEKAGYSGRNIVEAGGFVAQKFGSPSSYVLEAFGSPIYGAAAAPYWNQMRMTYGFPQGYYSGYGTMLPEQHFSIYGSGFASLPQELGGQIPGKGQRFSGAPME